ncbi:hypothetical protein BMS3Bbin15_00920 [archaeon BMS3Bbin15]|nr:hypothetical protein BMS3Bbin15_00920 [archaeon BMS3Bbin15]
MCDRKTVLFEEKYNVDISEFLTTEEVDKFIEKKEGKKLEIVSLEGGIVNARGNVFPVLDIDIDSVFDKTIGKKK